MTTTTAPPTRCNRCHRVLTDPTRIARRLGRVCAARLGLAPERRVRVRRPARTTGEQPALFDLDEEEINESEGAP